MSTQEASELEYLAGELEDAERALRRVVSLRERANEYEAERNTLVTERDAKQRELKRVRRGFLGAWLLVRGEHVERVQVLERALSRIEQRLAMKDRAISSAMSELRGAEQEAKRKPIDALRESFEARTSALREHLASESP